MNRRNLSGITILHKFDSDTKAQPTSIEDCPDQAQIVWIESMDLTTLRTMTKILLNVIRNIGDKLDIQVSGGNINFNNKTLLNEEITSTTADGK